MDEVRGRGGLGSALLLLFSTWHRYPQTRACSSLYLLCFQEVGRGAESREVRAQPWGAAFLGKILSGSTPMSRMRRGGLRSWVRSCGYAPECVVWSLLRFPIEGEA